MVSGLNWLQGIQVSLRADAEHKPPFSKGGRRREKNPDFFFPPPFATASVHAGDLRAPRGLPRRVRQDTPSVGGEGSSAVLPLVASPRPRPPAPPPSSARLRAPAPQPCGTSAAGARVRPAPGRGMRAGAAAALRSAPLGRSALRSALGWRRRQQRTGPGPAPLRAPPRALIGRRDKSFCGDGGAAR